MSTDLATRFLEARTARGVGIKTAAKEIGVAFSGIIRMNRGERISARLGERLEEWIADQPAPEPDNPDEIWLPVLNWEGEYEVSNFGRVRSLARRVEHASGRPINLIPRMIRLHPNSKSGHLMASLTRGGKHGKRYVHQLVLEAFHGPMPEGMGGCHNDGIVENNNLSNLRWDTYSENQHDRHWHAKHRGQVRPEVAARLMLSPASSENRSKNDAV